MKSDRMSTNQDSSVDSGTQIPIQFEIKSNKTNDFRLNETDKLWRTRLHSIGGPIPEISDDMKYYLKPCIN